MLWSIGHQTGVRNLNSSWFKLMVEIPTFSYGFGTDSLMSHRMLMPLLQFSFRLCCALSNGMDAVMNPLWQGVGNGWSARSLPAQTITWFEMSDVEPLSYLANPLNGQELGRDLTPSGAGLSQYIRCLLSEFGFHFRMIDWVSWPLGKNIDKWIIALLKGLAAVKKFSILIEVTLSKIEKVSGHLEKLFLASGRSCLLLE